MSNKQIIHEAYQGIIDQSISCIMEDQHSDGLFYSSTGEEFGSCLGEVMADAKMFGELKAIWLLNS